MKSIPSSSSESTDLAKYSDRVTVNEKTKSRSRSKIPEELYNHVCDGKSHRSRNKTHSKSYEIYSGESMDSSSCDRGSKEEKTQKEIFS